MSGPIEQNSMSGGNPAVPEDPPEITAQEEQEALAAMQNPDEEEENDEDDDDDEDEEEEDFMAEIPPAMRALVDHLKELNTKRDSYMEEYLKERAALEQKYHALCVPLFEQRRDTINGENSKNEIENHAVDSENNVSPSPADDEIEVGQEDADDVKGIPEFWTLAMSNIETIEDLITERDTECVNFLKDISCQDFPNGLGFTLSFLFKPNPYFTNSVLTKRYDVPNLLLLDDEPILKNVTGCEIDWKEPEMCLTHRVVCKKQRNKKGQIRQVKKKEKTESFFHFFSPPKLPEIADIDEEEADAIEEAFDHDYDVAQQFRAHIVPKAVLWFTGEAMNDALGEIFEGEDTLLSSQMSGTVAVNGTSTDAEGNPFLPPATETGEPECKQS